MAPQGPVQRVNPKLTEFENFPGFHRNSEHSEIVNTCQKRSLAFAGSRCAQSADSCETRILVTRLYQWLRQRAIFFRVASRYDATRTTVRTEVTIQETESAVLFTNTSWSGPKNCPLCGNPMFPVPEPLSEQKAQALKLGHRDGQCPGPEDKDKTKGPRQGDDRRRLR